MRAQIASPMPLPGYSVRECKRLKTPKMVSAYSRENPIPLSLTENCQSGPFRSAEMEMAGRELGCRYLMALPIRF